MAEAVLEVLLENLSSFIQKELGLFLGINQELKRLSSMLSTVRAVLEDAEEKQFSDRAIQNWLQKLKDAVHALDDILDLCAISASQNKVPSSCFSSFYPKNVLFRHKIARQMKEIREGLDEIAEERRKFHLCENVSGVNEVKEWRQTTSIITQPEVFGREMDKLKMVHFLVEQASNIDIERDVFGNIMCFKMHDLMHDLAQSVMEEACHIGDNGSLTVLSRTRHISFIGCNEQLADLLNSMHKVQHFRTCLFFSPAPPYSASELMKFSSLRVLHMGINMGLAKFPSSVINLKHIRYLNLSHSNFKTLPDSLCSLQYLQVLNLDDCRALEKLPNRMRYLGAMRHLFLRRCTSLSSMPPNIGQLTCLRTLNIFTIGRKKGFLLDELKQLNLKGELHIKHLERIRSVMDAEEANLADKDLHELLLSWGRNDESELEQNVEHILEALKPNLKLKILGIGGYKGVHFPQWMGNPTLDYLCSLYIVDCKNCLQLPPLHKLPSLKGLTLHNINLVQYINDETCDGGVLRGMRSLGYLKISDLPNLEGLSKEEGVQIFPNLCTFIISECPKFVLPPLPSVRELVMKCNGVVLGSIHNLHALKSLWLYGDFELTSFPDVRLGDVTSLKELHIFACTNVKILPIALSSLSALVELHIEKCFELESLPAQVFQGLHSLQRLKVGWCNKLKFFSDGFQYLSSLKELMIVSCPEVMVLPETLQFTSSLQSLYLFGLPNLTVLPDWLGSLTCLESLEISDCPKLKCIPMGLQCISNLKSLNISACPELLRRCEVETGEDWQKIAHILHVNLRRGININPMITPMGFPINLRVEDPFFSKTILEHEHAARTSIVQSFQYCC
ncbi:hypothetical protein L6164_026452 [Bauhinia variegata]|uniref:Uncharacterized protein n=1 Tax=Bauhinia variegata TaxID=167791 RepID=A0ACB9LQU8_BAUVA|nr:hypothetical protein L6164_026452 [Bauhinia variegata]